MVLIQASKFTFTIGNAIASPNTTTDFKTKLEDVGSNEFQFAPVTKEFEFKEPEKPTEEVKFMGATSGIQNSELDPQAPTKGEFTGTLIGNPEDTNEFDFEQFKLTASATKPSGYIRYNYASAAPTAGVAVVIQENNGTGGVIANWLLNNAVVETLGGVKCDADGHATQDVRITAAADDCWKESDADGGS